MDKWDEICSRITRAMIAEESEAALLAGLTLFAEFGRTLELLSQDTDRLATAAERLVELAAKTAEPEPKK